jgi:membrane-bound metal-dependent hydrolase YbcI (DUF457 family)
VILWYAAPAVLGAWAVLRDPRFDYRLAALGALLPDVLDLPFGHRAVAHTLVFAVGALVLVMAATVHRRPLRSRLLAVPVGLFAHLVLHGVVGRSALFYWPFLGDWGALSLAPSAAGVLVRESVGVVAAVWIWRRFGLADDTRRGAFLKSGRLEPC